MLKQHPLGQLEKKVPEVQCALQLSFGGMRGAVLKSCPVTRFIGNNVVGRTDVSSAGGRAALAGLGLLFITLRLKSGGWMTSRVIQLFFMVGSQRTL